MNNSIRFIATGLLAVAGIPCVVCAADAPAQRIEVASATVGATAAGGCVGDAALSPLQQRLLEKYDQSPQILMQYVWRTRAIYLLDRMETARWAESYRNTNPKC